VKTSQLLLRFVNKSTITPAVLIIAADVLAQQPNFEPKSQVPSPVLERPSQKFVRLFSDQERDSAAMFKRAIDRNEWDGVNAINIAASSTYESAVAVDLISMLHLRREDVGTVVDYLGHVRSGLAVDINMLNKIIDSTQVAVIREQARSLRNDMRAFDMYIGDMVKSFTTVSSGTPSGN
jgi:hypothetical protein